MGNFLSIKTLKGNFQILHQDIIRVEAYGPYSRVYYSNSHVCCCRHVKSIMQELSVSPVFYRVHRSHIINVTKISSGMKCGRRFILHMIDGAKVPVSKREKPAFANFLRATAAAEPDNFHPERVDLPLFYS